MHKKQHKHAIHILPKKVVSLRPKTRPARNGRHLIINLKDGLQFQGNREKMARPLGGKQNVQGYGKSLQAEILCVEHVPVPFRSGIARRPSFRLHSQRHLCPLQAPLRLQRAQPHGL